MIFAPCATIFSIQPANQTPFHPQPEQTIFRNVFAEWFYDFMLHFARFVDLFSDRPTTSSIPPHTFVPFLSVSFPPSTLLPRYLRDIYEKPVSTPIEQRSSTFLTCRRNRGARNRDETKNCEEFGSDSRVSRGEDRRIRGALLAKKRTSEDIPRRRTNVSPFSFRPSSFVSSNPRLSPETEECLRCRRIRFESEHATPG